MSIRRYWLYEGLRGGTRLCKQKRRKFPEVRKWNSKRKLSKFNLWKAGERVAAMFEYQFCWNRYLGHAVRLWICEYGDLSAPRNTFMSYSEALKQDSWRRNQRVALRRNSILWLWLPVKFKFFYAKISIDEVKATESTWDITGRDMPEAGFQCLGEKAKKIREMWRK